MSARATIVLEPAAQEVADAFSKPPFPFLYELEYPAARKILDDAQVAARVEKLPIAEEWVTVPSAYGDARVRLIRPKGGDGILPVILYMHGGGWVLGNAATHDRLVRELAVGAEAALAFVEYPNALEGRYPVAIEQGYATAQWITREGSTKGLDPSRMAVAGESVGRRHDCRADADGQGTRRREVRARGDLLPGHRRGDGHRLLRGVCRRALPDAQVDGVVLGRVPS